MSSQRCQAFFSGVKAELPLLVGVSPFGMIYGVLAIGAGIPPIAAQAMSSILFAGSSQFVATQLVTAGVPGLVMILTIAIVNLRHALYSISIAPHLFRLPRFWKAVLAYLLTDEAYAMAIQNYENERKNHKHWFFLGAGLALWTTWQVSTAAGILLGAVVPSEWSLDFALPLTFIAIVIPSLKDRAAVAVALTSGVLAVAVYHFPYKLGLMVAAFSGILVGLLIEVEK